MPENHSVRGKGFSSRADVETVMAWVDETSSSKCGNRHSETVAIDRALGRVLMRDTTSPIDVPSFCRGMMDGYAIRAAEIQGANEYNPIELQVVGRSMPGHGFDGKLPDLQKVAAIEIMTGAPFPDGPNAVLPFELTRKEGEKVFAVDAVPEQKNVGMVGEDIEQGSQVFSAGQRLRPQDIGILASLGIHDVEVLRRPRVGVLITGNEIVPSSQDSKGPFQIFDSNGPMLQTLIERDGGQAELIYAEDHREIIAQHLCDNQFDLILVSGGSSVGKEDFAPSIVAEKGELQFHGIAMRPSSPTGVGVIDERLVFLLPGNPVSCMCAYDFFAGRAIRKLAGKPAAWPYEQSRFPLGARISSVIGRVDYCRVKVVDEVVHPIAIRGASVLSTLSRANGFVIVGKDSEGYAADEYVDVFLFPDLSDK